jgi:kumamolisin
MEDARKILPGSERTAAVATLVGKTDPAAAVTVTVVLARRTAIPDATLQQHAHALPSARPVVDHAQFAALYGAPDDAIAAVRAFATTYGLSVKNVDQARRVVELSGTVAQMERAFGTTLNDYRRDNVTFRGREGALQLPASLAPFVEAVLGLDNRPIAKPHIAQPRAAVSSSYSPNQLATLYGFPANDGTGQTVALIELGGNYGPADLATYFKGLNIKEPQVKSVSVSPGVPVPYGQDTNSDGEVMLDVEVVGAIAPGAAIVVYFSDNTDQGFYQAVSQAVHDPATTAISISWGSPEKGWTQQSMTSWQSLGQSAIMLNVSIFAAAGDHGCADESPGDPGYDSQRHVDFPGSCDTGVVSCGGTNIKTSGTTLTGESVWNDGNGWAGGGGVSTVFKLPSWQQGISAVAGTPLTMRGVPDVAGDADPNSGIVVRADGSDGVSGGTSAVAPLWAALTARLATALGHKPGFFIPLLYANAKAGATNDVTTGNNSVNGITGFSAKAGWDACTGLGSPKGQKIASVLGGSSGGGT